MAIDQKSVSSDYVQLTSVRVPLEQAADAFVSPDASGRTPIVIVTQRQNRISNVPMLIGVVVLAGGILWGVLQNNIALISGACVLGFLLIALGLLRSLFVRIPEGVYAVLLRGGKYLRTIESGTHLLSPIIVVSHLVTRRVIPFEVPVNGAPTRDNVRASVQVLVTFSISDPYRFVYRISASDFDQVFQAACQNALRAMVRQVSSDEVNNLTRQDTTELGEALSRTSEPYGVQIMAVHIVSTQPPEEFIHSQEARQLAVVQQAEQAEQQALARQRQTDQQQLAQQRMIAEAEAEELRLAKLQDRLRSYPQAAQWEWEGEQLEVARGLASNTHAVVQVGGSGGGTNEIARAFLMRGITQDIGLRTTDGTDTASAAEKVT
jgi:regulator of protease activity HflC (stomatin/prohibitin superfamily)